MPDTVIRTERGTRGRVFELVSPDSGRAFWNCGTETDLGPSWMGLHELEREYEFRRRQKRFAKIELADKAYCGNCAKTCTKSRTSKLGDNLCWCLSCRVRNASDLRTCHSCGTRHVRWNGATYRRIDSSEGRRSSETLNFCSQCTAQRAVQSCLCLQCYRYSENPDDFISEDTWESYRISHSQVCRTCFDESVQHCDNSACGREISRLGVGVHSYYNSNSDDYLYFCSRECWNTGTRTLSSWHRENSHWDERPVHSWNYKPAPRFHGNGPRYFGVELEVECPSGEDKYEYADVIASAIGTRAYLKRDGSLENGFEIVTHPMDLPTHREFWRTLFTSGASRGLRSHDTSTCGLHVHVNRDSISKLTLGKFVYFVNHPTNKEFLETFARRDCSKWAYFAEKKLTDGIRSSEDHYSAVCLRSQYTIELRIFRGTLIYRTLVSAIEFLDATLNWCESASMQELRFTGLAEYIRKYRKVYPNCMDYLVYKGLARPYAKPKPAVLRTAQDNERLVECVSF